MTPWQNVTRELTTRIVLKKPIDEDIIMTFNRVIATCEDLEMEDPETFITRLVNYVATPSFLLLQALADLCTLELYRKEWMAKVCLELLPSDEMMRALHDLGDVAWAPLADDPAGPSILMGYLDTGKVRMYAAGLLNGMTSNGFLTLSGPMLQDLVRIAYHSPDEVLGCIVGILEDHSWVHCHDLLQAGVPGLCMLCVERGVHLFAVLRCLENMAKADGTVIVPFHAALHRFKKDAQDQVDVCDRLLGLLGLQFIHG